MAISKEQLNRVGLCSYPEDAGGTSGGIDQPAYSAASLASILAESSAVDTANYYAASAAAVWTFSGPPAEFVIHSIDGASRFIGTSGGVSVYFKNQLTASLAYGESYAFLGPALFRGLDGYTGDISGVFVTQPALTTGLEDLGASIANADVYAREERALKADRFYLDFTTPVTRNLANVVVGDNLSNVAVQNTGQLIPYVAGPEQRIRFSDGTAFVYLTKGQGDVWYDPGNGNEATLLYRGSESPQWKFTTWPLSSNATIASTTENISAFGQMFYLDGSGGTNTLFMNLDRAVFRDYPAPQPVNSDLLLNAMGAAPKSAATKEYVDAQAGGGGGGLTWPLVGNPDATIAGAASVEGETPPGAIVLTAGNGADGEYPGEVRIRAGYPMNDPTPNGAVYLGDGWSGAPASSVAVKDEAITLKVRGTNPDAPVATALLMPVLIEDEVSYAQKIQAKGFADATDPADLVTKSQLDAVAGSGGGGGGGASFQNMDDGDTITAPGYYYYTDNSATGRFFINIPSGTGILCVLYTGWDYIDLQCNYTDGGANYDTGFRLTDGGNATFAVINGQLFLLSSKNCNAYS